MKTRKIGTFTLGTSLVVFGLLFIARIFTVSISYQFIMKLWPVIFIFLGIETLISYFRDKEGRLIYDGGAIFIMALLTLFAMGMGCIEFFFEYAKDYPFIY